jgi:hypothetical protein
MEDNQTQEPELFLMPYGGGNGIIIYCRCCGREMEETVNGHYPPIRYESDKYNRKCQPCQNL